MIWLRKATTREERSKRENERIR